MKVAPTMKPKLILCLALALSCGLLGCSTVTHQDICKKVTTAINKEDWAALRKLVKPEMKANGFITMWENYAKTGHAVRVGKFVSEEKNSTIYLDGEPCAKYSYILENKDGTPNPHWLQIMVREDGGKTVLLDFWNFGW
jgi:hypothetical protein